MEPIFKGFKAFKTCSAPGDSSPADKEFQRSISWTWQFGGFICLSVQSVLLKCSDCEWNFCLMPHPVQGSGTQGTHYPVCIAMWEKNPAGEGCSGIPLQSSLSSLLAWLPPSLSHRCRRTSKDRQIVFSYLSVGLVSSCPWVKLGSACLAMILAGSSIPLEAWWIKRYSKVLLWLLSSLSQHAL